MANRDSDSSSRRLSSTAPALAVAGGALALAVLAGSRVALLFGVVVAAGAILSLDMRSIKRLLLAAFVLEMSVPIDQYLGYDDTVAAANTLSGYVVSIGVIALGVLSLLLVAERIGEVRRLPAVVRLIPRSSMAYLAVVSLSALLAIVPSYATTEAVLIGEGVLGYACVVAFVRTRDDIVFLLTLMATGLALQSLLVIAAVPSGNSLTLGPVQIKAFFERAGGSFGSANVLASFVTLGLASSLALIALRVSRARTLLGWSATALGVVALILTQSRGGWIGSGIALAVFTVAAIRQNWVSKRMLLTWMAAGGGALVVFGTTVLTRLSQFNNSAALARVPLNRLALGVIGDNPILGSGANNFAAAMASHLTVDYSTAWISTVHNKYLLVWAETGLLGLALFLTFIGGVLWCGRLLWKSADPLLSPLGATAFAAFAGTMAHMAVEIFHARVQYQMMWIVAGVVHAGLMLERSGAADPKTPSSAANGPLRLGAGTRPGPAGEGSSP